MVQLDLICNILHSWDKRIALDKIFRNAKLMRSPFSPGTWKSNVGRKRCPAVTLATSAGGSEEVRLVNRVVVAYKSLSNCRATMPLTVT